MDKLRDKVKLPKEVAEAIEFARVKLDWTEGNILTKTVRGDWEMEEMLPLKKFVRTDSDRLLIAQALVNGYEVEQTPEDEVIKMYNNMFADSQLCVRRMLDLLNIKIKGVNDHE